MQYIGCVVCLNLKGERVAAEHVVSGYSVCEKHVELASKPGFDIFSLKTKRKVT